MLSDDFDVAGVAIDGRYALETARQVQPDVIVLDVDMPVLDGFRTCRALAQGGFSSTPVVFLSMHDADEIVDEAFRCGGKGYVLKTRVGRDLVTALDQALLGRRFVPSLSSLLQLTSGGAHVMQVHNGGESFLDGIASLFDLSLRRGDATCVVGTEWIREGVGDRLRSLGWDIGGPSGHKRYLALDAADALNQVMRNGEPDPDRLAEIARDLEQYRCAVTNRATSRLTVFGDMVTLLSAEGNSEGLLAVETLWTQLTDALPFLTLCGYTSSCFHEGMPDLWSNVCTEHWALSHARDA